MIRSSCNTQDEGSMGITDRKLRREAVIKKKRKINRKKRKKKNGFRLKKFGASLFVMAAVLICDTGGYEYGTAGSIVKTVGAISDISEYIKNISQSVDEIGETVKVQISALESFVGDRTTVSDENTVGDENAVGNGSTGSVSLDGIPEYTGNSYVEINGNVPVFTDEEKNSDPYEFYSELDELGRCGYAEAKITTELMPTEERGEIGMIRPSGWHTVKYDGIDGNYLYNRCHLIGYQLTGENANEKNLITGTRYLNVEGMLPWENLVADYIQENGDAVMYRVTPVYDGDNLLASGVQMEAESLGTEQIKFNIFVFNVQPGIGIDYTNGDSWQE